MRLAHPIEHLTRAQSSMSMLFSMCIGVPEEEVLAILQKVPPICAIQPVENFRSSVLLSMRHIAPCQYVSLTVVEFAITTKNICACMF